ncbi:glycosyltransferase family 9 protein [Terriglobus aquaticus]|uniref:ADP-heptose:LPS heptosyltransferase n=1 Tax=Terriglobus aquaticus TaxID=940139 RepID=A0ABW9KPN3_9BACT|nr:hypothetical protein [Terriglobus aquaticus]
MSPIEQAEAHLGAREVERALGVYASIAEPGPAELDRIDGGRWMCHMLAGEYAAAWRCSDAIRARGGEDAHRFWTGEPIDGKRLMLRCLHGYGDTVMYLRWLPELRRRCSEVIVQACPEMLPLLEAMVRGSESARLHQRRSADTENRCCPARVTGWAQPGESDLDQWDVQVECAELPFLFRATTATLPEPVGFVFPEAEAHRIRTRMGERTKPRVGLVWTGSNYDPARSIPFSQFRRLLENHSVEFWSLQAPENNAEWNAFCAERGWSQRRFYMADESGNVCHAGIADMAAFAREMDVLITIDTMAAHVAGSLGLPTWLLLKREADWRWMIDREDSPWYPTTRLFRQAVAGEWEGPLTRVCDALRDLDEEMCA